MDFNNSVGFYRCFWQNERKQTSGLGKKRVSKSSQEPLKKEE